MHTCALKTDGSRWCWGDNRRGQLGLGHLSARLVPTRVLTDPAAWLSLAAGDSHTCGLTTVRALYCWGSNDAGWLGLGDTITRSTPTQVIAGTGHWYHVTAGQTFTCGTFGGSLTRHC